MHRSLLSFRNWLSLSAFLIVGPVAALGQDQVPAEHQNQHQHQETQHGMSDTDHSAMGHSQTNRAGMFLMNESSGTGFQPAAWPMPMAMTRTGNWHLMWMGQAFLVATQQSGPRGRNKFYSSNWGMLGAVHKLG